MKRRGREVERASVRETAYQARAVKRCTTLGENAMGWFDKLLGQKEPEVAANSGDGTPSDARALERYRYLVRTAPPESLEEAHREAFSRLSPEQRARALEDLNAQVPASERIVDARRSDPDTLARAATRAELRQLQGFDQKVKREIIRHTEQKAA